MFTNEPDAAFLQAVVKRKARIRMRLQQGTKQILKIVAVCNAMKPEHHAEIPLQSHS